MLIAPVLLAAFMVAEVIVAATRKLQLIDYVE